MKEKAAGHKGYAIWKNVEELERTFFNTILPMVPRSKPKLLDQMERALTSIGANFIEGYYSDSSREFIRFSRYSRRSLAELEYWTRVCSNKRLIPGSVFLPAEDLLIRTGYLIDRLILSLTKRSDPA